MAEVDVMDMLKGAGVPPLEHLCLTKGGHPWHPLYVPYSVPEHRYSFHVTAPENYPLYIPPPADRSTHATPQTGQLTLPDMESEDVLTMTSYELQCIHDGEASTG